MIIVVIAEWFSENMGYVENKLPDAFGNLGYEVHLITSNLQVYGNDPKIYKLYEPHLGPPLVETGVKKVNGYTIHRLPNYQTSHGIGLVGLYEKFKEINPDIVYLFEINVEYTLQTISYKNEFKYKIFNESRLHLSVYIPPKGLKNRVKYYFGERMKWKQIGKKIDKIYPIAPDVLFVLCKYYGQDKRKCSLSTLAVDTLAFKPISTSEESKARDELRERLGVGKEDILCIYTGRFTDDKGTIILAQAIDALHKTGQTQYKAVFVGTGDDQYILRIKNNSGCIIHPFVQSADLVKFYQAADIGVWPKQESTSQLDAAACGLPIIISSNVEDVERIRGNGLSYKHEDFQDLATKIRSLSRPELRKELGKIGVQKIREFFSWDYIAKLRLKDFQVALGNENK